MEPPPSVLFVPQIILVPGRGAIHKGAPSTSTSASATLRLKTPPFDRESAMTQKMSLTQALNHMHVNLLFFRTLYATYHTYEGEDMLLS